MILAQIDEITKAVTAASNQSDHWLFLFVSAMFAISGYFAIRYFMKALSDQQTLHNEYVKTQMADNIRLATQMNAALEDNTEAMKRVLDALEKQK